MTKLRNLPATELILVAVGVLFRIWHLFQIDLKYPLDTGGVFYHFSESIRANGFKLPTHIDYITQGGIPFAYPPLPFYVEALITAVLHPPLYMVINLLPAIVAVISFLSFYYLLKSLPLGWLGTHMALVLFAAFPITIIESTGGASLAENFGWFFLIWLAFFLHKSYQSDNVWYAIGAGAAAAGCVNSAPGTMAAAVPTLALFAAMQIVKPVHPRSVSLRQTAIVAVTSMLLSAPYLLTVISNHGIQIFTGAFLEQANERVDSSTFSSITLGHYPLITILLGITLILAVVRRRWLVALWFVTVAIIPREGPWLLTVPASVMLGYALTPTPTRDPLQPITASIQQWAPYVVLAVFTLPMFINAIILIQRNIVNSDTLTPEVVDALAWIDQSLPDDAQLLILSGDSPLEFSPAIARRDVINIPYGAEWQPGELQKINSLNHELRSCSNQDCVAKRLQDFDSTLRTVYLYDDIPLEQSRITWSDESFDVLYRTDDLYIAAITLPPLEGVSAGFYYDSHVARPESLAADYDSLLADLTSNPASVTYIFPEEHQSALEESDLNTVGLEIDTWPPTPENAAANLGAQNAAETINLIVADEANSDPDQVIQRTFAGELFFLEEMWYGPIHLTRYAAGPASFDTTQLDVQFEGDVTLHQAATIDPTAEPGSVLRFTVTWSTREPFGDSFSAFLHILDADGNLIAQHDGVPLADTLPTTNWPGSPADDPEFIIDRFAVQLPPDIAPGTYAIRTGLYNPVFGNRLLTTTNMDSVELGTLTIQ